MRLCLLGNSHLAAIKRAWDLRSGKSDLNVTFFGSTARSTRDLRLQDRVLVPTNPALVETFKLTSGTDRIVLDAFDAFVLVGISFEFRHFLGMFKHHTLARHRAVRANRPLLSDRACRQIVGDLFSSRPGSRLISIIVETTGKPVVCVASPCPAEEIMSDKRFSGMVPDGDRTVMQELYEIYLVEAAALARRNNFKFFAQPEETLLTLGFTQQRYSVNSVDCGWTVGRQGPQKRGDSWHMNADYGKVVLDRLLPIVAPELAPPQSEAAPALAPA